MAKVSKATKKFQSKHLKDALDQRRKDKFHQQRIKGRRGNKTEDEKRAKAGTKEDQKLKRSVREEVFRDMSVEQFFDKSFDLPKANKKLVKTSNDNKSASEDESEDELEAEDEEVKQYLAGDIEETFIGLGSAKEEIDEEYKEVDVKKVQINLKQIKTWALELKNKPNMKVLKKIVDIFQYVVEDEEGLHSKGNPYIISDPNAFQEVIQLALKQLPLSIIQLVAYKEKKGTRTLATGSNVTMISSLVKIHTISLIKLLSNLEDADTTDAVLSSANSLLPYIHSDSKNMKKLIKAMIEIWGTTEDDHIRLVIVNYLVTFATEFKKDTLESLLKNIYTTFIKTCRKTNNQTLPIIESQMESIGELFMIDETMSYQVGFEFIRQLALHLRNTINATSNSKINIEDADYYKIIYNWQFCHSLNFWSHVIISAYDNEENKKETPVKQLLYPLAQTVLGTIRLIPTPQFYPLRFHLARTLINISQVSGDLIPVFSFLNEILFSTTFTKSARKDNTLTDFDFVHNIKCSADYVGTRKYQENVWEETVNVILEYLYSYCKHISFPELVTPIMLSFSRFNQTVNIIRFNKQLSHIMEQIQQHSDYIQSKRLRVDYSPGNNGQVTKFLNEVSWETTPLGSYIRSHRSSNEKKLIQEDGNSEMSD